VTSQQANATQPRIIPAVIRQHADDSAFLFSARSRLVAARQVKLRDLRRFDDRLAAHLDGLTIAGDEALKICDAALAMLSPRRMFVATVLAIQSRSAERLNRLYALAEAAPDVRPGLESAFAWVEQRHLRGTVAELLSSENLFHRRLGIAVCAHHRVDAGHVRAAAVSDNPSLQVRALQAVGEMGYRDLLPTCLRAMNSDNSEVRFWAGWSAVLLGNRGVALEALASSDDVPEQTRASACLLVLQAMDQEGAHALLRSLGESPESLRLLIEGSGVGGDATYVPWLIRQMMQPKTARLAGEAFSLITGLDLANLHLDRKPGQQEHFGPNNDPNDGNVDMDVDEGLPWPDADRISRWWESNASRFESGTRYFLGGSVTWENCLRALKEGYQRQRILAAHYLCLLEPGTPLFEWRAPAFRQQRLLSGME
jgi:uncharacterized protein (TIGR02270 family)